MSAFITLESVAAATPDGRRLFENLTLSIGTERIGLVGRNGVGKSSLLAILAGTRLPAAGTVARAGTVVMLDQAPDLSTDDRLVALLGVAPDWDRLSRIEAGQGDETDLNDADWDLPGRITQALADVGLGELDPERPARSLSGGQATRAAWPAC
jgi:ATPase subunit of ABC transporter with duplicated ATPase domains